ncbi:MAG: radical SAM protein [Elusimicrobiota bacterium]
MRVSFVYLETFWTELLGPEKDRYVDIRTGADLPLGLATVRAYAQQDPGIRRGTEMINLKFHDAVTDQEALAALRESRPDVAAFSIFLWNAPRTLGLIELLKKDMPEVRIVVGGPEIPRKDVLLKEFFRSNPAVDICVCGEGEEPFRRLLLAFAAQRELTGIEGLAYRENGRVVVAPPSRGPDNLEDIPSPYLTGALKVHGNSDRGMICVESSRGCPLSCSYCDYHAGRRSMRKFSLQRLRAELETLRREKFAGVIYITDPFLNIKKKRCQEVFRILQQYENRFLMELKAEHFDDELIAELGKVPCATVAVGIQTTGEEALKNINRPFDIARCEENIAKIARFKNIRLDLEFILGLPGDSYESFKRSLDWALRFVPDVNFTLFDLVMLPNAPLADRVAEFKIKTDAEGLVASSYSFSAEDMMRSSWLFVAYCYIRETPKLWADFDKFLRRRQGRPSDMLEKVAQQLLRSGFIPRERIVGQGGRRGKEGTGKRSRRWVEISPFTNIGVEAEAWW